MARPTMESYSRGGVKGEGLGGTEERFGFKPPLPLPKRGRKGALVTGTPLPRKKRVMRSSQNMGKKTSGGEKKFTFGEQ